MSVQRSSTENFLPGMLLVKDLFCSVPFPAAAEEQRGRGSGAL